MPKKRRRQEVISLGNDGSSMYKTGPLKEKVEIEDVSVFFSQHNIKDVDLMKINIEGGEYELLSRLIESGLINDIKNIQVQLHCVNSNSEILMGKICRELKKTHSPTYQYKYVWENWVRS